MITGKDQLGNFFLGVVAFVVEPRMGTSVCENLGLVCAPHSYSSSPTCILTHTKSLPSGGIFIQKTLKRTSTVRDADETTHFVDPKVVHEEGRGSEEEFGLSIHTDEESGESWGILSQCSWKE